MNKVEETYRMKLIKWTEEEMQSIRENGGKICEAAAEKAMERNKLHFGNIETINDHHENHRWGSTTDRKYRRAAINKAIRKVAANPLFYAE